VKAGLDKPWAWPSVRSAEPSVRFRWEPSTGTMQYQRSRTIVDSLELINPCLAEDEHLAR